MLQTFWTSRVVKGKSNSAGTVVVLKMSEDTIRIQRSFRQNTASKYSWPMCRVNFGLKTDVVETCFCVRPESFQYFGVVRNFPRILLYVRRVPRGGGGGGVSFNVVCGSVISNKI
jgi:hypothetical protein